MRGWSCPNETFDLVAGGTGCTDGSHNPNSVYSSEEAKARPKAQAKLDYPNARGKGENKGKGKGKSKGKGKGKGKGAEWPRWPPTLPGEHCRWDQQGKPCWNHADGTCPGTHSHAANTWTTTAPTPPAAPAAAAAAAATPTT
jgi:hypothetical protein